MKTKIDNSDDLRSEISKMIPADDNVPTDMTAANQQIQSEKISMQIEGALHSGHVPNYLKTDKMRFTLPYPLEECDPEHKCIQKNVFIVFGTTWEKTEYVGGSSWVTRYGIDYHYCMPCLVERKWIAREGRSVDVPVDRGIQDAYFAKYPMFELFRNITPYNTVEKSAFFFGISKVPFDPVERGFYHIAPTIFLSTADRDTADWNTWKNMAPTKKDVEIVEMRLKQLVARQPKTPCNDRLSKVFEANQKQVFDFQNTSGLTMMKMVKTYNYMLTGISKAYIPLTNWMFHGESEDRMFTVPLPDKQPLYNLQDFHDSEYVVICPNIEIADKMQREKQIENVVFTSFVCDRGYYNQVDFSELENKHVALLVVNHSGMEVEDAVIEGNAFYTYLSEMKNKIKYAELCIIQTAVKYHLTGKDFHCMKEYVTKYKAPEAIAGSTFLFRTEEEIAENYSAAVEQINKRNQEPKPYWVKDTKHETVNDTDKKDEPKKIEQLSRGIIARGCITYFIGESGIGKTNITASLCAYLVNNSERAPRPFAERFWTRCKIESEYERLKIVHLDFDNDEGYISQREKNFVDPYMPDDPEERKACKENYIVKSMIGDRTNYSAEENFNMFCELLDGIKANDGVQGQPIDILVIDTYWAFTHGNDTKFDVFRKLLSIYPNMAIVVLHHLQGGKSYGRGDKLFEADTTIEISRKEKNGTLETPFTVQFGQKHRTITCPKELEPFHAKLDENNHFIVIDPEHSEIEMLKILRKSYKDLTQKELADLLGMSVNTLANRLKK